MKLTKQTIALSSCNLAEFIYFIDNYPNGIDINDFIKNIINNPSLKIEFKILKTIKFDTSSLSPTNKAFYDNLIINTQTRVGQAQRVDKAMLAGDNIAQEKIRTEILNNIGNLDYYANHSDYKVRKALAELGYKLDILINDKSIHVRVAVAKQGFGLDKLIDDVPEVRRAIAEKGYAIDKLIHDPDIHVRIIIARLGYSLEQSIIDSDPRVKVTAIRHHAYGLDKLINDDNEIVRAEVARQSYGLETLLNDKSQLVRDTATRVMIARGLV